MAQPANSEDALLTLAFSIHSNPGAYALLLGAGVSAPSGIPTAWGVLEDLVARLAELLGVETDDPMAWYQAKYAETAQYETLLERLAPTPLERQRLLKSYFEPTADELQSGSKGPTAAHRAIARLVRVGAVKVIVTLNFDRLIEQAIRDENIEPTVVATESDVVGLAPLHTLNCCVIHLHGDYLNPTSMRNTRAELASYSPATAVLLQRIVEEYGLIIAGWSSSYDPALRHTIAEHYPARLTLSWIEPNEPIPEAEDLRSLKKGVLFPADADEGFGRIADAVESMAARNTRHPMTVAVAVESAKRELAGGRTAVRLHDTIGQEFIRLHALPDFHLADYMKTPEEGLAAIRARVEEATGVASALVATLAYWGDDKTDEWWIGELQRFAIPASGTGYTDLQSLRLVSGTALYYSAGIAAIAARRFDLAVRMLTLHQPVRTRTDLQPLADVLGEGIANPLGPAIRRVVRPLLRQSLSLGEGPLDDAWQMFEVLRLAKLLSLHPNFQKLSAELRMADIETRDAQSAFDLADGSVLGSDGERVRMGAAFREFDHVLGRMADLIKVWKPHLLATDRSAVGYRNPVAEQLAIDLKAQGASHPLSIADRAPSSEGLVGSILAVSVAVGRAGQAIAYNRLPSGGGIVQQEIWLDSGLTPDEVADGRRP